MKLLWKKIILCVKLWKRFLKMKILVISQFFIELNWKLLFSIHWFYEIFYCIFSGAENNSSKTYICDFEGCGKALKTLTSLKLHTSTHSTKVIVIPANIFPSKCMQYQFNFEFWNCFWRFKREDRFLVKLAQNLLLKNHI